MNLRLDGEQTAVVDLASSVFDRGAAYEGVNIVEVRAGFSRTGLDELMGRTDGESLMLQTLVAEMGGRALVQCNLSALLLGAKLGAVSSVAMLGSSGTVRFPGEIGAVVRIEPQGCCQIPVVGSSVASSPWSDPRGAVERDGEDQNCPAAPADVLAWWRTSLSAEAVGAASAALATTWAHVRDRTQFGAPLSSRQAVRHRLAEVESELEAARLATYEAAWRGPDPTAAALAAASVALLVRRLVPTLHRFTGATGLAMEHPLHGFTGRVRSLAVELGSPARLTAEYARRRRADRQSEDALDGH